MGSSRLRFGDTCDTISASIATNFVGGKPCSLAGATFCYTLQQLDLGRDMVFIGYAAIAPATRTREKVK